MQLMLLTALFVITLVSLFFAGVSIIVAARVSRTNKALQDQTVLHATAMESIAKAMSVLQDQHVACDTNIRKLSEGFNSLARAKANDLAIALASIPSEMLPQA